LESKTLKIPFYYDKFDSVRTLIAKCVLETNKKETIEEKDTEHEKEDIIEEEK
jgi:hypothetical protein